MNREKRQQFNQIIQPVVEGLGFEYVGCDYVTQGHSALLRVYVDSPTGISVDSCTLISRQLSGVLDVEDIIRGRYRLEVSSPGLERPLFTLNHFQQFIGKRARIKMSIPQEGQSNFTGNIVAVQDDNILLLTENGEVTLPFAAVAKASLVWEQPKSEFEKKRREK